MIGLLAAEACESSAETISGAIVTLGALAVMGLLLFLLFR